MERESTSVLFRPDLQAEVNEYAIEKARQRLLGLRVAPIFRSSTYNGQYPIFRRSGFKKKAEAKRNANGTYNQIQAFFGAGNFSCDENGLEGVVDDATRAKYATLFDAEKAVSKQVAWQVLLNHEYRVSQLFANGGFTNHNVAAAWSVSASSDPLEDLSTGIDSLKDTWGVDQMDITLIIPRADFREMMKCAAVADKSKYTFPGIQPGLLSAAQAAAMLGIKQVLVAESVYDSANEGLAEVNAMFWPAGVMYLTVCANEDDDLDVPSSARTVLWENDSPDIITMETYRSDERRGDVIRARHQTDEICQLDSTDPMVYQLTNT